MPEANRRMDDRRVVVVARQVAPERLVDLELVGRQVELVAGSDTSIRLAAVTTLPAATIAQTTSGAENEETGRFTLRR